MATFVLVHGAWHGGWCWARTAAALRGLGHDVHAPTLTGLGERSHLLTAQIDPDAHVLDIVNVLRWRDLSDAILVGHSYGGLVVTGVAGQVPERLRTLVYLDAFVPEASGEAVLARASPARMAGFRRQIEAGAIGLEPDAAVDSWTDDPATKAWLLSLCTPHPKGCFERGVTLTGREGEVRHRHFILAARNDPSPFRAEYDRVRGRAGWTSETIPTLHDAMVEAPRDLAARLDAHAAATEPGDAP